MLYPLAIAYGGPKESELKLIRENFVGLQQEITTARLAVFPPAIVNNEHQAWPTGSAKELADVLAAKLTTDIYPVSTAPGVAFMPVGRNQMKFMWNRARTYSSWVAETKPAPQADYLMFADYICAPGSNCYHVGGLNLYVADSEGNIAYTTVINSKHGIYQRVKPHSIRDCSLMAVERFTSGIKMDVKELYPPYGVG